MLAPGARSRGTPIEGCGISKQRGRGCLPCCHAGVRCLVLLLCCLCGLCLPYPCHINRLAHNPARNNLSRFSGDA